VTCCKTPSLFVWLWLVVNDRKFLGGTVFFSHKPVNGTSSRTSNYTNQPTEQAILQSICTASSYHPQNPSMPNIKMEIHKAYRTGSKYEELMTG
jgi:hypothetical protein